MYKFISADSHSVVHLPTSRCIYLDQPPTIHTENYFKWRDGWTEVTTANPDAEPPTEAVLIEHEAHVTDAYIAPPVPAPLAPEVLEAQRIVSLWQAAHDYEYAQISGSAIGLLAIGVMQQLPKCLAVQAWIKSIWTAYYLRKATASTDTNFSVAGLCPHSVPELMVELGL